MPSNVIRILILLIAFFFNSYWDRHKNTLKLGEIFILMCCDVFELNTQNGLHTMEKKSQHRTFNSTF